MIYAKNALNNMIKSNSFSLPTKQMKMSDMSIQLVIIAVLNLFGVSDSSASLAWIMIYARVTKY